MRPDPSNDRSDLEQLRGGDEQALGRLVARWKGPLIGFALRYWRDPAEARDLVAQTFVRFYQHRHRLKEDSNVSAWLFTTLANLCRNQRRWRWRHPTVALDENMLSGLRLSSEGDPIVALQRTETIAALEEAMAGLPHKLKTALLLHQYERLSHRQIGEIVRCSEKAVEVRLYRARQQLRRTLKAFVDDGVSE